MNIDLKVLVFETIKLNGWWLRNRNVAYAQPNLLKFHSRFSNSSTDFLKSSAQYETTINTYSQLIGKIQ